MTSFGRTRAELIRWLGDAIQAETEKPFDEIDYDFVEECSSLLDELMGKSAELTEEKIAEMIEKLNSNTVVSTPKKIGFRKLWTIGIAAALITCLCVTVMAIPAWRQAIFTALQIEVGESIEDEGIQYINGGKGKIYKDIDSLISSEKLDILSFEDQQGILKIRSIDYVANTPKTIITFNDPTIAFVIFHERNCLSETIKATSEVFTSPYFEAYLYSKEQSGKLFYNATIYVNNDSYLINSSSLETLYAILNSLKKENE